MEEGLDVDYSELAPQEKADVMQTYAYTVPSWSDPETSTTIAAEDRVCFDPEGRVYGDSGYAWNTNAGWIDFNWSSDSADADYLPQVDLGFLSDMAYTGDAYWSGYAWSDTIGWIQFDWTCTGCDLTQRVHTVLPEGWPNVALDAGVDVTGYAWSDEIGWINFGSDATDETNVDQDLYVENPPVFAIPDVYLIPDPYEVNKYGLAGSDAAPLADGEDGYKLLVKLWNVDEGEYLDDKYTHAVKINVTPTSDSHVYLDQIAKTGDAISFGAVTYDADLEGYVLPIHSLAPTSGVNGYDEDGDGTIDYYFDPENDNHYTLESVELSVDGYDVTIDSSDAPLWGMDTGGDPLNLEFAPAIEVTNLNFTESDGSLETIIPFSPYQDLMFEGLVSVWSNFLKGVNFEVKSTVAVDDTAGSYDFLFDNNNNDSFLAAEDFSEITSSFLLTGGGDADALADFSDRTTDYVPLDSGDTFTTLAGGSVTDQIAHAMIVEGEGCTGDACSTMVPEENYDLVFEPDMVIRDVYVDSTGKLTINYGNQGYVAVPQEERDACPKRYTYIDDVLVHTYSLCTIPTEVFYEPNGFYTGQQTTLTGNHKIDVHIDATNVIQEDNEDNNWFHTRVGLYPDLTVDGIWIGSSGELTVDVANISTTTDVPLEQQTGSTYIYIDPPSGFDPTSSTDADWTYSWSTLTYTDFFTHGWNSVIQPEILVGEHTVVACVDPKNVVTETNEDNNNCLTKDVNYSPDMTIDDIYVDPESMVLVVIAANHGNADVPDSEKNLGTVYIYIDDMENPEWTYSWKTLTNKDFLEKGLTSPIMPQVLTGDHIVRACIDYTEKVTESDEFNNCTDVVLSSADITTSYRTEISYSNSNGDTVRYYSNYLPHTALEGSLFMVPAADEYKFKAVIEGSITSLTADQTLDEDTDLVVIGDLSTREVRNELFKRFSELTKGVEPYQGDFSTNTLTADLQPSSNAVSLLNSTLLYFKGDTRIHNLNADYAAKTLVVVGGDVFIDDDLIGTKPFGLIVFKDSEGNGGNVYIHSEVMDLNINLFADGSLLRYAGDPTALTKSDYLNRTNQLMPWDLEERREILTQQLYIGGSIISQNTIGGNDGSILPDGSETTDPYIAREYDLNDASEFVNCWVETDISGIPVDQDADGQYEEDDGTPDLGDMARCPAYGLSQNLEDTGDLESSSNEPFHLKYIPPPSTLPILGGSSAVGISLY
ncbi:MAG: hypothetical protein UW70_C0036G0002 [Candidatus Peregrinibacteria bacterium GW2011_GWA2_44_7]|nr:MAG: hypothetical protein UW70_C0036G0002 [Candidatus Peregrinibacteria bacterium GW2011_GWA2_44_7]